MEQLELKHLVAYLPYGLNGIEGNSNLTLVAVSDERKDGYWILTNNKSAFGLWGQGRVKLILRPLSDYIDINSDAMNHLNCDVSTQIQINELAIKYIGVSDLYYSTVELCLLNHIDIFGLIDKGLAVPLT